MGVRVSAEGSASHKGVDGLHRLANGLGPGPRIRARYRGGDGSAVACPRTPGYAPRRPGSRPGHPDIFQARVGATEMSRQGEEPGVRPAIQFLSRSAARAAGTYSQVGVWRRELGVPGGRPRPFPLPKRLSPGRRMPPDPDVIPGRGVAGRHGGQDWGREVAGPVPTVRGAPRVAPPAAVPTRSEAWDL